MLTEYTPSRTLHTDIYAMRDSRKATVVVSPLQTDISANTRRKKRLPLQEREYSGDGASVPDHSRRNRLPTSMRPRPCSYNSPMYWYQ